MGGNQSRRQRGESQHRGGTPQQPAATREQQAPAPVATQQSQVPDQVYDVVITTTPSAADIELASLIKASLETTSIPVYSNSVDSDEAGKFFGKVLVDAKLLVFVVSEAAAESNVCQDQVSLAYISNKPIIIASKVPKNDLLKSFKVGMRLTLQSLHWSVFDKEEEKDTICKSLIQLVQEQLSPKDDRVTPPPADASRPSLHRRHARLNTKLRQQSTVRDFDGSEGESIQINTFWERNFEQEDDVPWYKFQQAFLSDYEAQLSGLFNEDNIPWLLEMLKDDVFDGKEKITKTQFMEVRGDSRDKNAFWRVVSQIAVEKFNMKEVFNMTSTVRLTAIEKLATFQNPAVIEALITLINDPDPNVRAVAAISLGRTGSSEEYIIDALIGLLKDNDRIVRQSACLSLGTLKAAKAIPHIGHIWRNDFISVVRNAARTALENMKIDEAKRVLEVTKVLEEEIDSLAGKQVAV